MRGCVILAGMAVLSLAACERPSAVAKAGEGVETASAAGLDGGQRSGERGDRDETPGVDHRRDAVPELDGKPLWASSRRYSAEESAQRAFDRNGAAFGAKDRDDFVRKARAFVDHPPRGAETLKRGNGDTLIYDARDNVFAVADRTGAPRTMFKPDDGAAYWAEQKTRESKSRQARNDRDDRES